jgi:hypothetical protein
MTLKPLESLILLVLAANSMIPNTEIFFELDFLGKMRRKLRRPRPAAKLALMIL